MALTINYDMGIKLGGWDISAQGIQKVENVDKKQSSRSKIINKITRRQLIRQTEDIQKWRLALQTAEQSFNPDRVNLVRVYNDVILDAHLTSIMNTIRMKVADAHWFVCNADGSENKELTERIKHRWFRRTVGFIVDAKFWGHSLIQLGAIKDNTFTSADIVPREYVMPDKKGVKKEMFNTQDLVRYDTFPYKNWVIEAGGDPKDFGLLNQATPWALWKKNAMSSWSEFAEMFGMPLRIGKTDTNDPAQLTKFDAFLKDMGAAAYAIIDTQDELEFVERNDQDAHRVFDQLIERANGEMSKLILGQTMSTDSGSSRSQAEVHENVMNSIITAYKAFCQDTVNEELVSLMITHGMLPEGSFIKVDHEEKVSLREKFDMVEDLLKTGAYVFEEEWMNDTFNLPAKLTGGVPINSATGFANKGAAVQGEEVVAKLNTVMNDVSKLYAKVQTKHIH
ncbi:MAG: phage portal protein family protein [Nitrosomonadaceae bacterium]